MNGFAIGPLLILVLLGAAVILVCLVKGIRRRRGFMIISCVLLLLGLLLSFLLLPRAAYSRAVAERERAVAMQDEAMRREIFGQQSIAASAACSAANIRHPNHDDDEEGMPDEYEREQADATVEKLKNKAEQAVNEVRNNADKAVKNVEDNLKATVDATAGARGASLETNRRTSPRAQRIPRKRVARQGFQTGRPALRS